MSLSHLEQEVLAHYAMSSMTEEDMLSYFDCQSYEELPEEAKDFIDSYIREYRHYLNLDLNK